MKKQLAELVDTGILDEPIEEAARELLIGRNKNKKCRRTIHCGSTDIKMLVRQPYWSGGEQKKSRVFEIIIWIRLFIREAHGKLKRVTKSYKFERSILTSPIIPPLANN